MLLMDQGMSAEAILLDAREPRWCQELKFGGVPTTVTMLDTGDIWVSCSDGQLVVVERKTATDFLNTLRDERLFGQLARLRDVSPFSYLFICGHLSPGPGGKTFTNGVETGWAWASIQGALLTVQEIGVHVLHLAGDHDLEAAVIRLACRDRGNHRTAPARDVTITSEQEQILAALPGIGTDRASKLLEWFSPAQAISYLTYPRRLDTTKLLPDVSGVGDGTIRRVRKALGLDEETYLEIRPLERSNNHD